MKIFQLPHHTVCPVRGLHGQCFPVGNIIYWCNCSDISLYSVGHSATRPKQRKRGPKKSTATEPGVGEMEKSTKAIAEAIQIDSTHSEPVTAIILPETESNTTPQISVTKQTALQTFTLPTKQQIITALNTSCVPESATNSSPNTKKVVWRAQTEDDIQWVRETPAIQATKKAVGKPATYNTDDHINMAICLHHRVSSNAAGKLLKDLGKATQVTNRTTVDRASVLVYLAVARYDLATCMASSTQLLFTIDGSGTKRKRNFLTILFGGVDKEGKKWLCIADWVESESGDAETEVNTIIKAVNEINKCQRKLEVPETKLYHFRSCTYDNASVNTGTQNGVGIRFEQLRKKAWEDDPSHPSGPLPLFLKIGCIDHIADLASSSFSNSLADSLNQNIKSFNFLLKQLAKLCHQHRPEINHFFATMTKKDVTLHMETHKEVRFVSLDEITRNTYFQWNLLVLWQVSYWDRLTSHQRETFYKMADPEILRLIKVRALVSEQITLKMMSSGDLTAKTYKSFITRVLDQIEQALKDPTSFVNRGKLKKSTLREDLTGHVAQLLEKAYTEHSHFEKKLSKFAVLKEEASARLKQVYESFSLPEIKNRLEKQTMPAFSSKTDTYNIFTDIPTSNKWSATYLTALRDSIIKHTTATLNTIKTLPEDDNFFVLKANRATESKIGKGKYLLFHNPHMRGLVMLSRLVIQETSVSDLRSCVSRYSVRFKLRKKARKLLDAQKPRSYYNEVAAKKVEKRSPEKNLTDLSIIAKKQVASAYFVYLGRM